MIRYIFAVLLAIQTAIFVVAALETGRYTIGRSINGDYGPIYLIPGKRSGLVAAAYKYDPTTKPAAWMVIASSSGTNVVYTFQYQASKLYMTYDSKGAFEGVGIATNNVKHTFRLDPVDESIGRYRIIPPLKDGLAVYCGNSQLFAKWNLTTVSNGDDLWDFLPAPAPLPEEL
ncbi:hypothetical protein EC991_002057 [Linnemannia zychae]|nr:hypothetical protein EC991_002057 [Linnemannia zychae]